MLAGLGHRAVGRRDHEDGAVHLGRAGDHVLDVVGVAGRVDVGVVTLVRLVLHVGDVDGDAALALLGSVVDFVERSELVQLRVLVGQNLGDGRGQRRLTVVDVTDRTDVHVRLGLVVLGLCHLGPSWDSRLTFR